MANDVWDRLQQGVTQAIEDLILDGTLDGLPTVASQVYPDVSGLADAALPLASVCAILAPVKVGHTSASIMRRYPVTVFLVDPAEGTLTAGKSAWLTLTETIAGQFEARRFAEVLDVTEAKFCDVDWQPAYDPTLPQFRHVKASLTLWFLCWVLRS